MFQRHRMCRPRRSSPALPTTSAHVQFSAILLAACQSFGWRHFRIVKDLPHAGRAGFHREGRERDIQAVRGKRAMATPASSTLYDTITTDFGSGIWMKDLCQVPFLDSLFHKFAQAHDARSWKAVDVGCGMGHHTTRLLLAGASDVLALDVSKNMVEGAKTEIDKFLQTNDQIRGKVKFVVASATDWSSIPEAQEGSFDLAICVFVMCTLLSKEEVKQALAEIFKMLKPGGKLLLFEAHVVQYLEWDDKATIPLRHVWVTPKEDGTRWGYFEDEGKPREVVMKMNSGEIKLIDRVYTLSSWVSVILEAGFQITQLLEPYLDSKAIPADAPDYMKFAVGKPMGMCWDCTKPSHPRIAY